MNKLHISDELKFNDKLPVNLEDKKEFLNWPVVYILNNNKEMYIGETVNVVNRMKQHLDNPQRKQLDTARIIYSKDLNKSATLDIEASLIDLIKLDNDIEKKFELQNGNGGNKRHKYAQMAEFSQNSIIFSKLWNDLKQLNLVSQEINFLRNSKLFKYSPYKALNPDQCTVRNEVFYDLANYCEKGIRNKSIFITGSAGTGKSILGTYMLKLLCTSGKEIDYYNEYREDDIEKYDIPKYIDYIKTIKDSYGKRDLKVGYVIAMEPFRNTVKDSFKASGLLKKRAMSPYDVKNEHFDILIVDEAHRLKQNKNLGQDRKAFMNVNKKLFNGENKTQLDWIIKQSDYQIFLYDPKQSIKPTDVRKEDFDKLYYDHDRSKTYNLKCQMRVMADGDYVEYIDHVLNGLQNEKTTFNNYEFKIFDSIQEMENIILEKEKSEGLSRMVAGYAWPWDNKKNIDDSNVIDKRVIKDVKIENKEYFWNINIKDFVETTQGNKSIEEIGCIHSIQGFDLNYCGVIIGKDLYFNKLTNTIEINKNNYFDKNGKNGTSYEDLREYIINIYKVLLTRGIKGTYVYVCDDALREYLSKFINK